MSGILANLLTRDNPAMRRIADGWLRDGFGSPQTLILPLALLVMMLSAWYYWRWQKHRMREPGPRALLRLAGEGLGLSGPHRRLLWRLGRVAGLEPAVALVSPRMLIHIVRRGEQAGLELSGEETLQLGQILDAVSAAADEIPA